MHCVLQFTEKPKIFGTLFKFSLLYLQVGDGTTSVVLLAGEFLNQMKPFVEEGVHPRIIIKALRLALQVAVEKINTVSVKIDKSDQTKLVELLEECAATSMSSKLIHHQKEFFSRMVVKAVMMLDHMLSLNMIGIKKVTFFKS